MPRRSLLIFALLVIGAVTEARAEVAPRFTNEGSCASTFRTCASVQVRFSQPMLTLGLRNTVETESGNAVRTLRISTPQFEQSLDRLNTGTLTQPFILSRFVQDGGLMWNCDSSGRHCVRVEATTVTPEPMTMTLLGTGLVGLAGAGLRRRAKGPKKK
jgi:hypothetical protein